MRVLFITAFYPPCDFGWGYMFLCERVAERLDQLGHEIVILTSDHLHGNEAERPYPVYRLLSLDPDWNNSRTAAWQFFFGRRGRERRSVSSLTNVVDQFHPDIIFIWHANGLSRAMLSVAESLSNVKPLYYLANYFPEISDEYLDYWQNLANNCLIIRISKFFMSKVAFFILRKEGKPIRLRFMHTICVSEHVKKRLQDRGFIGSNGVVIHNGIDLMQFRDMAIREPGNPDLIKCMVAGRLVPEKGVRTVIGAFNLLKQFGFQERVRLTIIGDGPSDYVRELKKFVSDSGLESCVDFKPPVPINEFPGVLSRHDVLILSSEWEEPLASILLDAMASGLLVIGTDSGGTAEVLFHEKTGLVFDVGNPKSLFTRIMSVIENPSTITRLGLAGKKDVEKRYNIDQMVDRIEQHLFSLVNDD